MDPNANLAEQREIVQALTEAIDAVPDDHSPIDGDTPQGERVRELLVNDLSRLLDLHQALDEWLVKGGFLPDRWKRPDPKPHNGTVVLRGPVMSITSTADEKKEARQNLVYEKALKFVRYVAGSHYPGPDPVDSAWTRKLIDDARVINREAEEAWR
jgi:hypothetical protein